MTPDREADVRDLSESAFLVEQYQQLNDALTREHKLKQVLQTWQAWLKHCAKGLPYGGCRWDSFPPGCGHHGLRGKPYCEEGEELAKDYLRAIVALTAGPDNQVVRL